MKMIKEKRFELRCTEEDIIRIKTISEYYAENSSGVIRLLITKEYEEIEENKNNEKQLVL